MQAMSGLVLSGEAAIEAMPDPLPRGPASPPAEPIVIRTPPRRGDNLEINGSGDEDEDDGGEIRRSPGWLA